MSKVISKIFSSREVDCFDRGCHTFVNPYSYLVLRKKTLSIENIDHIHLDGWLSCFVFSKLFGFNFQRKSFDLTSIGKDVLVKLNSEHSTLSIVGSTTHDVNKFVNWIKREYSNITCIYHRDGYFESPSEVSDTINMIVSCKPDLVIVGMGAGKQEQFLSKLAKSEFSGSAFTCGGFIHQTASKSGEYYPHLFDRLNLRWLFRMLDEPKLIYRYVKYYPLFIVVFILDFYRYKKQSTKEFI
ncbi:WecB/TagA/CpsF family glycosyltransferase [Vibrio sp. RE86]|uniref:WecB/TagA/CpsF family glycosyltransferase n=1 Tax=Vibrio sp. RE86 TaxID=2607605 RepID=UPI0014933255|nr:WecB/TagA/CpsF family glycosyltransferase [Vibrio sp. RE86]NOH79910.1 WecB/TagA/CpsF family glycosyltransferase [Vibrio sp. RE86]